METATDLCNQANECYVSEDYEKAVQLYSEALALDEKRDDILCHRAQAYLQLNKHKDAAADCDKAIQLNEKNDKAYKKKGLALFHMDEIGKALEVFQEGHKRFESDPTYEDWVSKCEQVLAKQSNQPKEAPEISRPNPTSVKYDWYQTHTHVVLTVLMKNIKKENLNVDADERKLKVGIQDTQGGPTLTLDLNLAHKTDPQQASVKIFGTKVEIKLKKSEGFQWKKLEGDEVEEAEVLPLAAAPDTKQPPSYPSSSHYTRDWDKLAAEVAEEEKNEKLEGDAGLNQFFQKIYGDASDETKRAMMKSFSESGGTVLSTNWDEVGKQKVEVKPPDGMEYRSWET